MCVFRVHWETQGRAAHLRVLLHLVQHAPAHGHHRTQQHDASASSASSLVGGEFHRRRAGPRGICVCPLQLCVVYWTLAGRGKEAPGGKTRQLAAGRDRRTSEHLARSVCQGQSGRGNGSESKSSVTITDTRVFGFSLVSAGTASLPSPLQEAQRGGRELLFWKGYLLPPSSGRVRPVAKSVLVPRKDRKIQHTLAPRHRWLLPPLPRQPRRATLRCSSASRSFGRLSASAASCLLHRRHRQRRPPPPPRPPSSSTTPSLPVAGGVTRRSSPSLSPDPAAAVRSTCPTVAPHPRALPLAVLSLVTRGSGYHRSASGWGPSLPSVVCLACVSSTRPARCAPSEVCRRCYHTPHARLIQTTQCTTASN